MTSPTQHRKTLAYSPVYPIGGLTTPIPGVGTSGTLKITTGFGGFATKTTTVKKGDKITVYNADGSEWVYFSTVDIQQNDLLSPSIDVEVSPLIQAVHTASSGVRVSGKKHSSKYGYNIIGDFIPDSAKGQAAGGTNTGSYCLPHVRPWPWATDIHGIAYDQANLLALSFIRVSSLDSPSYESNPVYDAYGNIVSDNYLYGAYPRTREERALVPVPRTMPIDYTRLTSRQVYGGLLYSSFAPYPQIYLLAPILKYSRNATGAKDRSSTLAQARYFWQANSGVHGSYSLPINATTGLYPTVYADSVTGVSPYTFGGWASVYSSTYGPGVRGGTYCLSCSGLTYPNVMTDVITTEIWMTRPGQSDVLLKSLTFPSKPYTDPKDILSGTWSGAQTPAAPGTCCTTYMKFFSSGDPVNITMGENSGYTLLPSTQVPFPHSVATGNLVAPGGLIAPFY